MKPIKSILLTVIIFSSALFFSSCDENNPITNIFDAKLRAINSIANFDVNLFRVNSDTISSSSFQYTNSYGYRNLTGNMTHTVLVRGSNLTGSASTELGLTLSSNTHYTWFVHDNINASGLEITPVQDNMSNPATGSFKLRAINLSPVLGTVRIKQAAGPDMITGLSFKSISSYSEFTGGTYQIEVRDNSNIYYSQSVTLTAGKIYDLVISGLNSATRPIIFSVYAGN
jgi:hypothetical protein